MKFEIVMFSHITGKVETIECDDCEIKLNEGIGYVAAVKNENPVAIIPWNRVKIININK